MLLKGKLNHRKAKAMKIKKEKDERGSTWQTLILSKYEARILAKQAEDLFAMANGDIDGMCIGGANIHIELEKD